MVLEPEPLCIGASHELSSGDSHMAPSNENLDTSHSAYPTISVPPPITAIYLEDELCEDSNSLLVEATWPRLKAQVGLCHPFMAHLLNSFSIRRRRRSHAILYTCGIPGCGRMTFTMEKDLRRHQVSSQFHRTFQDETLMCRKKQCRSYGKVFSRPDNYRRHLRTMHGNMGVN